MNNLMNNYQATEKLVYNVPEVAQLLDIGLNSAYKLTRAKGFPCIHIGRKIIIPKDRFNAWINSEKLQNQ